jgi:hypothetical protein
LPENYLFILTASLYPDALEEMAALNVIIQRKHPASSKSTSKHQEKVFGLMLCDNQPERAIYIVYARHWDKADAFQIIAVIAPDAHETADALLPRIIDITEQDFHSLSESQIDRLEHY